MEGKTLKHTINNQALELDLLLDIAIQVADALDAAHPRRALSRAPLISERARSLTRGTGAVISRFIPDFPPSSQLCCSVDVNDYDPGSLAAAFAYGQVKKEIPAQRNRAAGLNALTLGAEWPFWE